VGTEWALGRRSKVGTGSRRRQGCHAGLRSWANRFSTKAWLAPSGLPRVWQAAARVHEAIACKTFRTASQAGRVHVSDVHARCGALLAISADPTPENYDTNKLRDFRRVALQLIGASAFLAFVCGPQFSPQKQNSREIGSVSEGLAVAIRYGYRNVQGPGKLSGSCHPSARSTRTSSMSRCLRAQGGEPGEASGGGRELRIVGRDICLVADPAKVARS